MYFFYEFKVFVSRYFLRRFQFHVVNLRQIELSPKVANALFRVRIRFWKPDLIFKVVKRGEKERELFNAIEFGKQRSDKALRRAICRDAGARLTDFT